MGRQAGILLRNGDGLCIALLAREGEFLIGCDGFRQVLVFCGFRLAVDQQDLRVLAVHLILYPVHLYGQENCRSQEKDKENRESDLQRFPEGFRFVLESGRFKCIGKPAQRQDQKQQGNHAQRPEVCLFIFKILDLRFCSAAQAEMGIAKPVKLDKFQIAESRLRCLVIFVSTFLQPSRIMYILKRNNGGACRLIHFFDLIFGGHHSPDTVVSDFFNR